MSLPTGNPVELEVARAEVKKVLPAKDGRPEKAILRLGCKHGDEKGWVEIFEPNEPANFPQEGQTITLVLDPPKQEGWAYNGRRPGRGASGRRRDPAETRAIQRQHSQGMALQAIAFLHPNGLDTGQLSAESELQRLLEVWADFFDRDIANGKAS